ncbi:hypothetical protein QYE77_00735 [Thermanaerothrix sp. 4228-RoL]|uniref:Uncharacterized protein n=1 Tax=Thermanaerothrix solaris TaxID=3058434 RepID=A0ABU3NIT8_9CHLR|nr:hypothetical protein [Thermanaerothrix sp. 4228-RoL]MDT8896775.1 hypothetical protein [Thermanaerothrix sp. 4228-RoL]
MNLWNLPIEQALEAMPPEQRQWFEQYREAPHLADASDAEIFMMIFVIGYLRMVLDGKIPFSHEALRDVLNFGG